MSVEDFKKSGEISRKAKEYAEEITVVGMKHIDLVEKIEEKIRKLGGKPSFPVDVSINSMAAHQTPNVGDEKVLEKGQVVKVDIGAHYHGYVTDNAVTVLLGAAEWKNLKKAADEALKAAIEQCTVGNQIRNIGKAIFQTIQSHGYNSIANLSGHGIGQWIVHDAPTIPNYDNGDTTPLKEGQTIAIEPFATDGVGAVKDGKGDGVYRLVQKKPVRLDSVRKVLNYIEKEFMTLPFSPRWLTHLQNYQFAIRTLEQEGVITQYTELPEKSGGMVAQAEKSVMIGHGVLT
jgi:methionyl aminopeptidase